MHGAPRFALGLMALLWLQPAWCNKTLADTHEECIREPIFEGRVCTVQANREARMGVILIHGLNGSVMDWQHTIPALSADFHVVAFDLPGFGKSDKGSKEYSPTRYARLAHFLADRYFQDKPYHIVGHSMGGAIALRLAGQRPARFQRLVLIDAAGILHHQAITRFQAGSFAEGVSGVKQTRGLVERLSGKVLEQAERLPISPFDIVNSALGRDHVLQGGPAKIAALALAGEDFSQAVSVVGEPTLVLWGDSDPVVPLRTGMVLAARMPRARLEIISGSGHVPMQDQTQRVNFLIRRQLLAGDDLLSELHQKAPPLPDSSSQRVGKCSGESGQVFQGDYLAIELRDCSNVTIRNVRTERLSAFKSQVNMIDTEILARDEGLRAEDSEVSITNGKISGTIAIDSVRSRFDLAGTQLNGSLAVVKGVDSKFVFSLIHARSPHRDGVLHSFKNMVDEQF